MEPIVQEALMGAARPSRGAEYVFTNSDTCLVRMLESSVVEKMVTSWSQRKSGRPNNSLEPAASH